MIESYQLAFRVCLNAVLIKQNKATWFVNKKKKKPHDLGNEIICFVKKKKEAPPHDLGIDAQNAKR